ncbi:hypothetical protein [Azospirillum brasilense]|uniref:hypothetical protein n=1 Tax=Azospirillum brasilense TaxID=192 RepID=UPI0013B44106|nr:hypothetical protein [Azospirillum brasilense]
MSAMFQARTVAPDFRLVETLSLGTGPLTRRWTPRVIVSAASWSPAACRLSCASPGQTCRR